MTCCTKGKKAHSLIKHLKSGNTFCSELLFIFVIRSKWWICGSVFNPVFGDCIATSARPRLMLPA
jgi:hypothetical protein